jgi:hypothetical protein
MELKPQYQKKKKKSGGGWRLGRLRFEASLDKMLGRPNVNQQVRHGSFWLQSKLPWRPEVGGSQSEAGFGQKM